MSNVIDQRVVEMRFDNENFEKNVSTSMSTLDKLKKALKFDGASKGLENVQASANKINFSRLSTAIDTVNAKFSYMQATVQHQINNMVDSVVNGSKRMVSALTIDPVKSGLREYETQINAVQTILANTQKEGTNVEIVNDALDKLNTYADKTIYNFTEMTRNIGTFTAAGVKLDTSVNAIQGIANLAAVSGSTSQQASTAMYQLSQALAAGKVQLMDWNSVVNAGMGGQVFQDALIRTSENLKTGAKEAINTYGSFRESLTKSGWLTTEVLTETLNQLAGVYSKSELMAQGYSEKQAEEIMQLAKTAEEAATKVKTFTQLWDVLKEAAQSGWAQTWRIIIGDFEEAKALLTPLSEFFTGDNGLITKMSNARNTLLDSALGKGFSDLSKKVSSLLEPGKKVAETISEVTDTVSDLGKIVDDVILGKFGNGQERFDALTNAGYKWWEVQNKVNETLGSSVRYIGDQTEGQKKLTNETNKSTEATSKEEKETAKLTETQKNKLKVLIESDEETLRGKNYTDEQIESLKELGRTAEKLGMPLDEFIDKMDEINGRWLFWNSLKNIGQAIVKVFSSIGKAWREVFDPIQPDTIFNAIAAIHKFTASLIMSDENAENLKKTFKGLFAIIDIVRTVVGGGLRTAFKLLSKVLSAFDMHILDLTANIGDVLVKFRDFIMNNELINKGLDALASGIVWVVTKLGNLYSAIKELPQVQKFISYIQEAFENLKNLDFKTIGSDLIQGFKNGLLDGVKSIPGLLIEIGSLILQTFKDILGIESPSWKTFEDGINFVKGFINGVLEMIKEAVGVVKDFGAKVLEAVKKIDWDKVFALAIAGYTVWFSKRLLDAFDKIANAFDGIGKLLGSLGNVVNSFAGVLDAAKFDLKSKAILKLAIAVAILVASLIALVRLAGDDYGKLWNAVGVIIVLSAVLVGLAFAVDKMTKASVSIGKNGANINGLKTGLIQLGAALLMLAFVVKIVGEMSPEQARQGFIALTGMLVEVLAFLGVFALLGKHGNMYDIDKVGGMMIKVGIALLLMVGVIKLISGMDGRDIFKGIIVIQFFVILMDGLAIANRMAGKNANLGSVMIKVAIAMTLMLGVVKIIAKMDEADILKGLIVMQAFVLLIAQMSAINRLAGPTSKVGGTLIAISASMLILTGVLGILSRMEPSAIAKGLIAIEGFVLIIAQLVLVTKMAGNAGPKIAATILSMSIAIAIIAGISVLLSMVSVEGLAKGIIAVGALAVIMSMMIVATRGASDVKGSIMSMAVAIGVMAAAIFVLSFIPIKDLAAATIALSAVMGMFALMTLSASKVKGGMGTLIVMTVAIGILSGVLITLANLPVENVMGAALGLSILMGTLALVMIAIGKMSSNVGKALVGILALTFMALPMLAFVKVLKQMSGIQLASENVKILIVLMASMTLLLIPLTIIGNFAVSALLGVVSLTAMARSLFVLIKVLEQMQGLQIAAENVKILVLVMASMTLLLIPLTLIGSLAPMAIAGVLALTAMALPMLAFIKVLEQMQGIQIATENVLLLMSLMTVMSDVLFKVGIIGPLALIGVAAITALTVLMVAIGALAYAIGSVMGEESNLQEFLNKGIPILEQLSYAVGSMIGNFIAGFSEAVLTILPAIGEALSGFMVAVMPFTMLSRTIDGSVLEGVGYLTAAILALTAANFISGIGQILSFGQSFNDLGNQLLGFTKGVLPFIAAVKMVDPSAVEAVNSLAKMLLALTASELLSGISSLISKFTGEETDFSSLGEKLKAFGSAVCEFSKSITGENAIDANAVQAASEAGMMMIELEKALPRSGGFLQDVIGEKDMNEFARSCAAFGRAMGTFSRSVSGDNTLDEKAIEAAVKAGKLMSELQNSLPRTGGWIQEIAGTQDITSFGESCVAFGESMVKFSKAVSGDNIIDVNAVENASKAGTLMSELQNTLPKTGGWWQSVAGVEDIETFGSKIEAFGTAMTNFCANTTISEDAVKTAYNAGTMMTELQKAIPEDKWFDGKVDLEDFGSKIQSFGGYMVSYSNKVSEMDAEKVDASISSANRLVYLTKSIVDLDTSGIDKFDAIKKIGTAISNYMANMGDIDASTLASSITSATRLRNFIGSLVDLDNSGISKFKIGTIGSVMKSYANSVSGMDTSTVSNSISAANKLRVFINNLSTLDNSGIDKFKVGNIGRILKSYSDSVSGLNTVGITNSVSVGYRLKNFINSLTSLDTSGVGSFTNAINKLGTISIDNVVKAFGGASAKTLSSGAKLIESVSKGMQSKQTLLTATTTKLVTFVYKIITSKLQMFNTAGSAIIAKLVAGIMSKKSSVSSGIKSSLSSAVSSIKGYYNSFYAAGIHLGSGLVIGINSKRTAVYNAAYALGQKAVQGEKDGQKSNSPSKLTIKAGKWLGEGLVLGIRDMTSEVYKAGFGLGNSAVNSISSTIAKISDYLNEGIDAQPTIRPIMDLSNVESGVGAISGMFNKDLSFGTSAHINAISSMMNERSQNGLNDDVVSAIDKLSKNLSNVGNTSYTINGLTYDDGSNVSEAIKTLLRAARIEGRA